MIVPIAQPLCRTAAGPCKQAFQAARGGAPGRCIRAACHHSDDTQACSSISRRAAAASMAVAVPLLLLAQQPGVHSLVRGVIST